jgi:hypothetical protein
VRRKGSVGFRRRYGASPPHLGAHLVALAVAALAFYRIFSGGSVPLLLMVYLGLVIAHDLIFVPLYTGLDRLMRHALVRPSSSRRVGIPMINHVRAPLLISALLLLIYSPLILGLADSHYFALSGHHLEHYLRNWFLITVALLLGSGLIYAVRVVALRRRAG